MKPLLTILISLCIIAIMYAFVAWAEAKKIKDKLKKKFPHT
jgi:uncharacterized membrane protein